MNGTTVRLRHLRGHMRLSRGWVLLDKGHGTPTWCEVYGVETALLGGPMRCDPLEAAAAATTEHGCW
jgi:hypothetical protein